MSKVSNNSNYNKVSVKTDSTVELNQELSKLGVFKEKRKPRAKKASTAGGDIRQDGPMAPGFTKSLGGPQMRNLPPIQQIQPGMTQQQIEDIQRTNNASIAALTGEIRQQRLQDIELQQGQRFEDITKLGGIINPLLERFRGSTFPAQASGDQPIDPFASSRGGNVIYLGNEPDVTEERFTETLRGATIINTTGTQNTAIGSNASANNIAGYGVVAIGEKSQQVCTAIENTSVGWQSLSLMVSGQQNTAIGSNAMSFCASGDLNTAVGRSALSNISMTGSQNVAIGALAFNGNTTGSIAIPFVGVVVFILFIYLKL